MDLCLRHGPDTLALELKVWRDGERDPLEEGLAQLDGYLAHATSATTPTGRRVTVVRA